MMNPEIISKLLKDILFLQDFKEVKKDFKIGEYLEGRILKKFENYFIIQLKNKGIVKAYSKVPIKTNNILLKVIKNQPQIELKILSEIPENVEFEKIKLLLNESENHFKKIKNLKLSNEVMINKNDFQKTEILKDKLKKLPEKIGLTYEKDILEKKEVPDSIKKEAILNKHNEILNFIEMNQKLNNQNLLFFPLFFKNVKNFEKGFAGFKRNPGKKDFYTVIVDLNLQNNVNVQAFIISQEKNLQITFSVNNEKFLNLLKKDIQVLLKRISEISNYNVLNISFILENDENRFKNLLNFFKFEDTTIIDIKT